MSNFARAVQDPDTAGTEPYNEEGTDAEVFDVDLIEIGSFVDEQTLFCPFSMPKEKQIQLEIAAHQKLLCWTMRGIRSEYRYELFLNDVEDALFLAAGDGRSKWLTLELRVPPRIYKSLPGAAASNTFNNNISKAQFVRVTAHEGFPEVQYGDHRVYRFRLSSQETSRPGSTEKLEILKRLDLDRNRNPSIFIQVQTSLLNSNMRVEHRIAQSYIELQVAHRYSASFDIFYSLQILLSHGYISKYAITDELLRLLCHGNEQHSLMVLEALFQRRRRISNLTKEVRELLPDDPEWLVPSSKVVPNGCAMIRKVIVTPTRVLFMPPSIEMGNRVLRAYSEYSDHFLRVSFTEEDQRRRVDGMSGSDQILERFRSILQSGILLGSRRYQFLAFSSSQLRDHSCWFFSDVYRHERDSSDDLNGGQPNQKGEPILTAVNIRNWMGDFSKIKTVAKYASRMGQCFSSTLPLSQAAGEQLQFTEIPDVERNGFCFSDGVGRLSPAYAAKVASELELDNVPSAFQIRAAGYKGVLSVDPAITDAEPQVQFRPSMNKFAASHSSSLEIIRYSQYSPGFSNHQLITLMECLGVKDDVLLRLQRDMQDKLDAMLDNSTVALNVLLPFAKTSPVLKIAISMILAGIPISREPFLLNVIHFFQCSKLREMKYKARIHIPNSAQLIGVLDEFSLLEYGQLFVQITDPSDVEGKRRKIITGTVVLAKMPAVHPGDIRVLQAVDLPELHCYVDVVVFPPLGNRPHTVETSGSDLDGDIYFVSWDQSLVPPKRNLAPMDYLGQKPHAEHRETEITVEDVTNFMVDYMRNDNLGLIAMAHKIHADLSPDGAMSDVCLKLAELHSIAVDFPKSGIYADFQQNYYSVREYPDFLGKHESCSYTSQKALGKLYRAAQPRKFQPFNEKQLDCAFLVKGFDAFVKQAQQIKRQYDYEVKRLMKHYDIKSEIELVSQLLMTFNRHQSRKEFEIKCTLENIVKQLRVHYRKLFWNDDRLTPKGQQSSTSSSHIQETSSAPLAAFQKASAWYFVSYAIPKTQFSFPWLTIGDLLIEIFQSKSIEQSLKVQSETSVRELIEQVQQSEEAFTANDSKRRQRQQQQQQQHRGRRPRGFSDLENLINTSGAKFNIDSLLNDLKIRNIN